jgi:dTDP-4-amino-4,6-dideoxygalactose transaminase
VSSSKLALFGGDPVTTTRQPKPYPSFSDSAIRRVESLLRDGTTVGLNRSCAEIEEAERKIAEWQEVPHCLGTSSGHAALHSALIGLEISSGDEVITSPYTWGASVSCILHNNAIPVFADIDAETGLLDPGTIEGCITPKTRGILVVHLFGQPADMSAIRTIADNHGLVIIEDGSQAHGALHRGKKVGSFGDAAGFSCMGGKLLATSEAGYMVTPSADVYWKSAMAGQHMGRASDVGFPENLRRYVDSLVYTYRLSPISAVLLVEQLGKLDDEIAGRRRNADHFRNALAGVKLVRFPIYADGDQPSYHMLTMNFDEQSAGITKTTYIKALVAEGVGAFSYVPSPIPSWDRLRVDGYAGPKVMWTENLARYGADYTRVTVPGCETRITKSVELSWNYPKEDREAMQNLADAFIKVEAHIDSLATWEKSNG